jgi:hypothetical protein
MAQISRQAGAMEIERTVMPRDATLRAVLTGLANRHHPHPQRARGADARALPPRRPSGARRQRDVRRRIGSHVHRRLPLPQQRVVLETDGHVYHRTRSAIKRDRRKEADLVTAGLRVLRSTWRQVERQPDQIGRMLSVALS